MSRNNDLDEATVTNTALPWEDSTDRAAVRPLHLVLAWSLEEPHRIGETASLASPCVLGRGGERRDDPAPRLQFSRQRPGYNERTPWIAGARLSRVQMVMEPANDGAVRVHNVGRCELLHNGQPVAQTDARAGDILSLKNSMVFLVDVRPVTLAPLSHYVDDGDFGFGRADPDGMVGESPFAWKLRDQLALAARADHHLLFFGESGVGKELAARTAHRLSARNARPLVARGAAASDTLADSELFGSAKNHPNVGAPERIGLLGEASASNLFLDEVDELSSEQQARLLRVLDRRGEYQRLSESHVRFSDFRLYAATNRSVDALKHDLLSRFAMRMGIRGLNERRGDIPLILTDILRHTRRDAPESALRFHDRTGRAGAPKPSPALVEALLQHRYAHHVRELARVVWLSMSTSSGEYLSLTDEVKEQLGLWEEAEESTEVLPSEEQIRRALEVSGGNRGEAAKMLGLKSRYALYRLMKKQGFAELSNPGD